MLVLGWTIMGRKRSSYDYTMGFGVSARVAQKSTRLSVTPPHGISNKINQLFLSSTPPYLFSKIKWLSCIIKFKLSPLERGTSEIRGLQISYNKTSKMPNSDAEIVFGHDRFIIGHDSRCAERRGLCLLT